MCAKGPQSRCPEVRCERSQRAAFIPCNLIGFSTDIASSSKGAIRGVTGHTQLQRRDALEVTCFKKVQSVRFLLSMGLFSVSAHAYPKNVTSSTQSSPSGPITELRPGLFNRWRESASRGPGRSAPDGSDLCQKLFRRNEARQSSLSCSCPITIPKRFLQSFSRATRVL